jgi:nicotinamide mononucleotide transporter
MEISFASFLSDLQQIRWQEWVSTLAQIASVYYARKNNLLVYPTGIVGVLLAAYVYFFLVAPPLYADGTLNLYYFLMSVYGWYHWAQKKPDAAPAYPISWCSGAERRLGLGLFLVSWALLYSVLAAFTNSNTPILDSLVSSSAITAMWWMASRKIENWLAWIASNLVAIPLNLYKGLPVFTLMYVLFLYMAWQGYRDWKVQVHKT